MNFIDGVFPLYIFAERGGKAGGRGGMIDAPPNGRIFQRWILTDIASGFDK